MNAREKVEARYIEHSNAARRYYFAARHKGRRKHQTTAYTVKGYEKERGNSGNTPERTLKPNPNDNFALKQGWKNFRLGKIK